MLELFKQGTLSHCPNNDPMKEALMTNEINRKAIGLVDIRNAGLESDGLDTLLIGVELSYNKDRERSEEYQVEITPKIGNIHTRYFHTRHTADAVFEKLVRDYELLESPEQSEREDMVDEYESQFSDGEDEDDDTESKESWHIFQ